MAREVAMAENVLYYGDNLDILRRYVKDETVDLIYLDPPFNSKATYNVLFGEQNGSQAAAQIKAFEDTWSWDQAAAEAYQEVVEAGGKVSQAMQAFRMFLGDSNMLAYLSMMAPRLVEMRRVLKPTGSIYLHCDPTASHYLKMLMDAVFRARNFVNEIILQRRAGQRTRKYFPRKHHTLLFYSKSRSFFFNSDAPDMREPIDPLSLKMHFTHVDENGRKYRLYPSGKRFYADAGKMITDVWTDIKWQKARSPISPESLGYPTQKPEALLQRVIGASSNEGGLVLDPFCGCGTTIAVAQRLNRRWIGIDNSEMAIQICEERLGVQETQPWVVSFVTRRDDDL